MQNLGGRVHFGRWQGPSHSVGRWEHQPLQKLFGSDLTSRIILVDLDFTDTTVEEFQALGLSGLEQLEILLLYGCNQLDDRISSDLIQLRKLQKLCLTRTSVGDDTILKLKDLPELKTLIMQSTTVSLETIEEVEKRPNLDFLR